MRILFIADIVPHPPNTGIKIRTFNIIRELASAGNHVYLVCFNHPNLITSSAALEDAQKSLAEYCTEVHIFDIPGERSAIGKNWKRFRNLFERLPYRVNRYFSEQAAAQVANIISINRPDIIHLDKTELYVYAAPYPEIPAIPTNHNVESLLFQRRAAHETNWARRLFSILQMKKTAKYEKATLSQVPAFITCTQPDLDTFRDLYAIQTPGAVIDNGVDVSYYSPRSDVREEYVLIIGAQSREATANFDATVFFMEQVWPTVRKASADLRLKIVGRDPDPRIVQFGDEDKRVDVIGFVNDERDYFAKAKALAVPLRVGGGSRLKILTAFAMGTPVVSTRIGAEGIECTDRENILLADQPSDFAKALAQIVQNPLLAEDIVRNARALSEQRYDWRVIGRKLQSLYERVISEDSLASAKDTK